MVGLILFGFHLIVPAWRLYARIVTPKLRREVEEITRQLEQSPLPKNSIELYHRRSVLLEKIRRANWA